MKANYDFTKAVRGRHADRVPPDAVFVRFDAQISMLLDGPGDFQDRLLSLAKAKRVAGVIRTVAMSPSQYRALRPLLTRLGAIADDNPAAPRAAGVRTAKARRRAG